ncbi:MAG: DNA polymerase III subunit gamma/tau [Bacteroidales bacterium]|nr:DNA polymerase III subunit gamma/tau [Bacteroidales bacterium]
MYRALYRKYRPRRFEDVVGQTAIVTALCNQVRTGHIGHAYLFTGTRGTGKTTCAKIFAKAINCPHPAENGDPCGQCEICRGIDEGSVLDVTEMDAASNNGVDNIRDLRDETVYTPSLCRYKVYIIDEVHMLSQGAFNALLKIMEEPPAHVVFILATTEIHKVPATILSRCQRSDFRRIAPEDIASRVDWVAGQDGIQITQPAAALIARLADGALRDALSILDTCAGVGGEVDEARVQQMAGVTDRGYLFGISQLVARQDAAGVLGEVARLRQSSVDMKRLCEELIAHYRNLMLAALPGGEALLSGVSPQEEERYRQEKEVSQEDAIRAIRVLGDCLEKMGRGTDPRVELELALFGLCGPEAAPAPAAAPAAPGPAPEPFRRSAPAQSPAQPQEGWAPAMPSPAPSGQEKAAPLPWEDPGQEAGQPAPQPAPQEDPAPAPPPAPAPKKAPRPAFPAGPFEPWAQVLELLPGRSKMLFAYLRQSRAYFDGKRVLIDGGDTFRDYIRADKDAQNLIKDLIQEVTGTRCPIGPYQPPQTEDASPARDLEATVQHLQAQGVEVVIEDK